VKITQSFTLSGEPAEMQTMTSALAWYRDNRVHDTSVGTAIKARVSKLITALEGGERMSWPDIQDVRAFLTRVQALTSNPGYVPFSWGELDAVTRELSKWSRS
jgi:hypothetical protein